MFKYITMFLSAAILIIAIFIYFKGSYSDINNDNSFRRCWGQLNVTKKIKEETYEFMAILSIIKKNDNTGSIILMGTITNNDKIKTSIINRVIHYSLTKQSEGISLIKPESQSLDLEDTTDDKLLHSFIFTPGGIRIMSHVKDNIYLIKNTIDPKFLCASY